MIKKKAKERMAIGGKVGADITNGVRSMEPTPESKPFHTSDEVAKIAGTSGATVKRTKFILETVMEIKGVSVLATCRNSKGSPYNGHPPQLEK